jgi:hypothetical protein
MKLHKFRADIICPKCAFPIMQMFRQFNDGAHDIIENKEVKKCKVKGEHVHVECVCGWEGTFRPLDWNDKHPVKKPVTPKNDKKVTPKTPKKPKALKKPRTKQ